MLSKTLIKKSIFILTLLFFLQAKAFSCALPPDILNEYKIIRTDDTIHIKYTLYTWKYLQNKVQQEIEKEIKKPLSTASIQDFAKDFVLDVSSMTKDGQSITLSFLSGSIVNLPAKDQQNYIPDSFIEVEFDTNILAETGKKQKYSLTFNKANFRNISNLIHAYIYSDIQENTPGDTFFSDDYSLLYTQYSCEGQDFAVGNMLEEDDNQITFDLFVDPDRGAIPIISTQKNTPQTTNNQQNQESSIGKYLNFFVQPETSTFFKVLGIFVAIILGMLHALLPGHAKLFVSTALLQEKSNPRKILTLITTITLSHTLFILILAGIILFLEKGISNTAGYITLFGAGIYALFGIYFIWQGYKNLLKKDVSCSCSHDHSHEHTHNCKHSHHKKNHNYLISGLIAGLNPCIDALAIFILALSIGNGVYAFWIILMFSLGLGIMLGLLAFGIGKLQIFAKNKNKNTTEKIIHTFTILSGIALIIISIIVVMSVRV